MRETSPRAPFDEGLFLAHFNRGNELYGERRFPEAEVELEEAYLLRPRDPRVLNLLGLVYFKQDKLEKAGEVYQKLAAESPEVHTLYYNLGLIDFKLGRLEDAESAFLKALELGGENPKLHVYLGNIYERLHRFQDAIFQYRQAGASLMVRRVEGKIAAAPPRPAPAPALRPPLPPRPAPAAPRPPASPGPSVDDTAEYKASDVQDALRQQEEALGTPKTVRPVGEAVLAEGVRGDRCDTNPLLAAAPHPRPFPEMISFPTPEGARGQEAPRRPETFRFLRSNLMEVEFSGRLIIKQGTVYSYSGNLTFWVKERRPGGHTPLVLVTGSGKLILTDKERDITFMQVNQEQVFVEPSHLLACEEGLTPRFLPLGDPERGLDVLALEGSGTVALSVASKPLALAVAPDMPVSVPLTSVITWTGGVTPLLVEDQKIYEVMAPGAPGTALVRLEGTGRLLVEQTT